MKRIPIIRTKPIQGIFDSDWDGVPNDQDCEWKQCLQEIIDIDSDIMNHKFRVKET